MATPFSRVKAPKEYESTLLRASYAVPPLNTCVPDWQGQLQGAELAPPRSQRSCDEAFLFGTAS